MTEQTDKASRKSGRAAAKKRPTRSRAPKDKRAKAPARKAARPKSADKAATSAAPEPKAAPKTAPKSGPKSEPGTTTGPQPQGPTAEKLAALAPDPATIVFGSNLPIVAQPQKVPEGSGLKFSGPSAGKLKACGPQPSSAKASGLTFTSAKAPGAKAPGATPPAGSPKANGNGCRPPAAAKPLEPRKAEAVAPASTAPIKAGPAKTGAVKSGPIKTDSAKAGPAKESAAAKPADKPESAKAPSRPALTKPAIAPQASGRRLEKERSSRGFAMTLVGLVVVVGGLAYWLNPGAVPAPAKDDLAAAQPAPHAAAPVAAEPAMPAYGPSPRAPVTPGPLAAALATGPAASDAEPGLTLAEIAEIQQLLQRLDLAPGNTDGRLTAETATAIRSYQEMAGLESNGQADRALLEDLRSVVELYGG